MKGSVFAFESNSFCPHVPLATIEIESIESKKFLNSCDELTPNLKLLSVIALDHILESSQFGRPITDSTEFEAAV